MVNSYDVTNTLHVMPHKAQRTPTPTPKALDTLILDALDTPWLGAPLTVVVGTGDGNPLDAGLASFEILNCCERLVLPPESRRIK